MAFKLGHGRGNVCTLAHYVAAQCACEITYTALNACNVAKLPALEGDPVMPELRKLGRYELRRVLGKGAMGVVYEGFDPNLSRLVAVKTILKSVALDPDTERAYSARFTQEAKAVARLNHPNIVQVYDFGVEGEVAYLVMEFIQGRELRSLFEARENFAQDEVVRIVCELLDALDFAHDAGVVHRDVKPANVMLDSQRRAKLADFGVARVQDGAHRSMAGTMVGTPAFMSPEQISGRKIDRRTDIFSAGTILYRFLTGEQPFTGDGAWTVAKKIMESDPPPPSSVVKSVSPAYDAIVGKALAKNPAQRFASAKEFATALREARVSKPLTLQSVEAVQQIKAETRASDTELEFWRSIQNRDDLDELELYVDQFPHGAYSQLARLKIAKLRQTPGENAQANARMEADAAAQAKRKAETEEQAHREAQAAAAAKREAEERVLREAEAKAKALREAEERARSEAEAKAKREADEKIRREAVEKTKREAEEKSRQAQALARQKQQELAAARARAAAEEDATVAIGSDRSAAPAPAVARKTSLVLPAIAVIALLAVGIGAFAFMSRKPAPSPVAEAPVAPTAQAPAPTAPPKAEVSAADIEKIRRETEERIRREYADKSAAEQAAAAKAAADKAVQEKQFALKAASEKAALDKAVAERTAAERAAAERQLAAKNASERAAAEQAAEKVAAEKAASERVAAENTAAAEKAAAEKAATEKAAAAKAAAARPGWPSAGDRWVYRVKDTRKDATRDVVIQIQRVTDTGIVDSASSSAHTEGAYLAAGTAFPFPEFSPYIRAFAALKPGDRWSNVAIRLIPVCQNPDVTCQASGRVAEEGKVTVPAGTFDAVRIEIDYQARTSTMNAGMWLGFRAASATFTYWYSTEARRAVKMQSRGDIALVESFEVELLSFKRN